MKKTKFQIPDSKFLVVILISSFWFLASSVHAQSLLFSSSKTTYRVGDNFQVTLSINTGGRAINTISGTVDVPTLETPIVDVRYGSSIVPLWVQKPAIDRSRGVITFAGGIPGGYNGSGEILRFGLQAKRTGKAVISLKDVEVLLNDGKGTKLAGLGLPPLTFTILVALPKPPPEEKKEKMPAEPEEVYAPPVDTRPPEPFTPLVARHQSVADNKYFVSFFAVDKDTGISHYIIHERPIVLTLLTAKWDAETRVEQGPYVLKNQLWPTHMIVQAYDQAGNAREASADAPIHPLFLVMVGGVVIVGAGAVYLALRPRYRRRLKYKV